MLPQAARQRPLPPPCRQRLWDPPLLRRGAHSASCCQPPAGGRCPRLREAFGIFCFQIWGGCVLSCRILDLVPSGVCSSGLRGGGEGGG